MPFYKLEDNGDFVVGNYRSASPFASFLPGIAGVYGIPMWVYYANRGQCICSFGVEDKNHAIMEFSPADKAYQEVAFRGFRTFIKSGGKVTEPFSGSTCCPADETMVIRNDSLTIRNHDNCTGLETEVRYFTIPNENFAALCRKVVIKNISGQKTVLEVLDGLAQLIPFGIGHAEYKEISNTLKAWMDVFNLKNGAPFFRVRASTADTETVDAVTGGFFCVSTVNGVPVTPIVDAQLIFGQNTSLSSPDGFVMSSLDEIKNARQITSNKVPCAFAPAKAELYKNEALEIRTVIGYLDSVEQLNAIKDKLCNAQYFEDKARENDRMLAELLRPVECKTASTEFDAYIRQCYLDNILRGGRPVFFENENGTAVYYVFSRKHGDLERDYNDFRLQATPYSQGNGNFRDVCQNRRCDTLIFPKVGDYNIRLFAELLQADGYNPLVVNGNVFRISPQKLDAVLKKHDVSELQKKDIAAVVKDGFIPGSLMKYLVGTGKSQNEIQKLFSDILFYSTEDTDAEFKEGYWVDHWTYILDLIESYLAVFPERCEELLFGRSDYRYYQSPVKVAPRREKYVKVSGALRQVHAVREDKTRQGGWMKTKDNKLFTTNLYVKLFTLALVKFAALDRAGIGIEMEAGKPGWNDSLNGLPSLFGSSFPETIELKRLTAFLLDNLNDKEISLPDEVYNLLAEVSNSLKDCGESDLKFWESISSARETYRESIACGFSGFYKKCSAKFIQQFLSEVLKKLDSAVEKAVAAGDGIVPTYFCYKPGAAGREEVKPITLPHFLEGSARLLKIANKKTAENIARAVKNSDLYDKKLQMFKISGSLESLPNEVGRARAFTPGFLENESVFLHMEYKYLLGLLKAGLYGEYFSLIRKVLVPFMSPEVYGRSILENSSFIVSSANPDPSLHGRGFVARLSGSNAEMLNMWLAMTAGEKPFRYEDGTLKLRFEPALPDWLFKDGRLSFTFLGQTTVTYHNPRSIPLYGDNVRASRIAVTYNDGTVYQQNSDILEGEMAIDVRNGKVKALDVYFE